MGDGSKDGEAEDDGEGSGVGDGSGVVDGAGSGDCAGVCVAAEGVGVDVVLCTGGEAVGVMFSCALRLPNKEHAGKRIKTSKTRIIEITFIKPLISRSP